MIIERREAAAKITDLQCRSMRDNLLFTGIQENDSTNRDTEDTLCTFIATQMNIKDEIPFELGRYKPDQEKPRPIIAKFHRFKDREKVRQSVSSPLENETNFKKTRDTVTPREASIRK